MIKPSSEAPSDTAPAFSADPPQGHETPSPGSAGSRSKGGAVGDAIKRGLKALFDEVAAEPVPAKLKKLLDELERKAGQDQDKPK